METRGRKPVTENSAQIKQQLAEIARDGITYLKEVAEGKNKHRPAQARIDIIHRAIEHTIGKATQSHDIGIQAEQMQSATELLEKLSVNRGNGSGSEEDVTLVP